MHTYRASTGPPRKRGWRFAGVVSALTLASAFVAPAASAATEGEPAAQAEGNAAEAAAEAGESKAPDGLGAGGTLRPLSHRNLPDQASGGADANDNAGGSENANENAGGSENANENAGDDAGGNAPETVGDNASGGTVPGHAADPAQDNANPGGGQTGDDGERPVGGQGNRGFIQVSADHDFFPPSNDPHVPCEFWLAFYNFREGTDQARVTFTLQPPTGGPGTELSDYPRTVSLNGEHTNGVTLNGFQRYDLTTALAGIEPHAQQGYHVKVTVETTPDDVSADLKHHVFWVDCDAAPSDGEDEEESADLRVQKRVLGDDAPGDAVTYTIAVTCDDTTVDAVLVAGETWRWNEDADATTDADVADVGPGSTCSIRETEDRGAEPVTVTFDGRTVEQGEIVTLVADAANRFLVTNVFEEDDEIVDLRVQKRVVGADAPADTVTYTIAVTCDGTTVDAVLVGGERWRWNEDARSATGGDVADVVAGSTCSILETEDRGADPITVTFDGRTVEQGEAVTLVADAQNRFLITNAFGEVLVGGEDEDIEGVAGGAEDIEGAAGGAEDVDVPGAQPVGSVEGPELGVGGERVDAAPGAEDDDVAAPADEDAAGAVVRDRRGDDARGAVAAGGELPRTGVPSSLLLLLATAMIAIGTAALRRSAGEDVPAAHIEARSATATGSPAAPLDRYRVGVARTAHPSRGEIGRGAELARRIRRRMAPLAVGCALIIARAPGARDRAAFVPT